MVGIEKGEEKAGQTVFESEMKAFATGTGGAHSNWRTLRAGGRCMHETNRGKGIKGISDESNFEVAGCMLFFSDCQFICRLRRRGK